MSQEVGKGQLRDSDTGSRDDYTAEGAAVGSDPLAEALGEVERLRKEADESRDLFLRDRAELENFKKRMQRERGDLLRYATDPLLRDLLPIIDNLERALGHAEAGSEVLAEGVRMVLKAFIETLDRHGVKRIDALGAPFDPAKHEALAHVESDEHPASHVTEQHQVGYQLHDRLIRPALVSVSKGKTPSDVASS
jgi:molecular chaperone GrpE